LLGAGLLIPLLLFVNRFLIPDVSMDSLNYHNYLGFKGWNGQNNKYEFYPTGIHNFSPVLDMVGYGFSIVLGYRLGTVFSVLAIYMAIWGLYKIFKLIRPSKNLIDDIGATFLFVSSFLSFELFLGIGSYFVDGMVATMGVWCTYWLLKYFQNGKSRDLWYSALMLSVMILGKQTNLYFGIVYFLVLILKREKFKRLIVLGVGVMIMPSIWYLGNWLATGNPVFPFYNAIFRSKYFEPTNFVETQFGGQNLGQKIGWFYYSILNPKRLGQVHDLFNDYKLNLYVALALPGILGLMFKKSKGTGWYLLAIFLGGYLFWALQFGYLRYGLVLEYLGGLLLLIGYSLIKSKLRYLLFLPLFGWLLIWNKRVINMSLAYDIAFRPGFFYNRESYPKEAKYLFSNKIEVGNKVEDFKPDIYLNCAVGGMTYYGLSPFNKLPVVNIDVSSYSQMTTNNFYGNEVNRRLKPYWRDQAEVKFVTLAAFTGLNTESGNCLANIKSKGWLIEGVENTTFLGYENQKLNIIYGRINRDYFDKME